MRTLSKSKLVAYLQCQKRLWLEIHHPELSEDSRQTAAAFAVGNTVGAVARKIYDPEGQGTALEIGREGVEGAITRTKELLSKPYPVFEAGFMANGALAFADVLLPGSKDGAINWRMVEVKASTSVKDYHHDDIAVQSYVARKAGVPLSAVALACIDSDWVYPGGEDYQGLLVEKDMTDEAFGRTEEVEGWITEAHTVADKGTEPEIRTGPHCSTPFECSFLSYCKGQEPQPKHPASWLPRIQSKPLRALIYDDGVCELGEVPDDLLNERQLRVKTHTLAQTTYFDAKGAAADLAPHGFPAYFMDFETTSFAVPVWKGTRPYQQIPFQFSIHMLSKSGKLDHQAFLDLSGSDPSKSFADAIVAACGDGGPVYAYNASFEAGCLKDLAGRFPSLQKPLISIVGRLVDLLHVAERRYYHPSQEGSWSIKAVLPAIAPDLNYRQLDGVRDGEMAMSAYLEAIQSNALPERREKIRQELLDYCRLDTYAMVRLWQHFAGRHDLRL